MNIVKQIFSDSKILSFHCASFLVLLLITSTICSAQIELSHFNDYKHYTAENGLPSTYI